MRITFTSKNSAVRLNGNTFYDAQFKPSGKVPSIELTDKVGYPDLQRIFHTLKIVTIIMRYEVNSEMIV